MSNVSGLNKTVYVKLNISVWSGQRRLEQQDLDEMQRVLPEIGTSNVSVPVCDPKRLLVLLELRRAAEHCCQRLCIPFLDGYATAEDNIPTLVRQLDSCQKSFEQKADALVKDLPAAIKAWAAAHPLCKRAIERKPPKAADVRQRTQFAYQLFRIELMVLDSQSFKIADRDLAPRKEGRSRP
jgi:hypothetical protein